MQGTMTTNNTTRVGIIRVPDEEEEKPLPLASFLIPPQYQDSLESVLIPHGAFHDHKGPSDDSIGCSPVPCTHPPRTGLITDRIHKLAYDINQDYADKTLHLLCVLKGGFTFFAALQHALINLCAHQRTGTAKYQFSFDFVRVKSYEGTASTGNVQITGADLSNLKGRHLLLVEDLVRVSFIC